MNYGKKGTKKELKEFDSHKNKMKAKAKVSI